MRRDEIIARLRQLEKMRLQVALLEHALEQLDECQREIIEKMYVSPEEKASDKICEMFDIEVASVYRRRNKALKKLEECLGEMR